MNEKINEPKESDEELRRMQAQLQICGHELAALNKLTQIIAASFDFELMLNVASPLVLEMFRASSCGIGLLNNDRTLLTIIADAASAPTTPSKVGETIPVPDSAVSRQLFEDASPMLIHKAQEFFESGVERMIARARHIEAMMIVPLRVRGAVIGTLGIDTDQPGRTFTTEEVTLAEIIAGQFAGAIANGRLFQTEQRQRRIAESLQGVTAVINRSLDLQLVLKKVLAQLQRVVRYDSAGILLRDGGELVVSEGAGIAEQTIGNRIALATNNPAAQVFRAQQPRLLANVQNDPDWGAWPEAASVRGWIGAPLVIGGEVVGVLTADSFEIGAYSDEDAAIMQVFANQAAIAIHNARLFASLRQELAERARIERELRLAHEELTATLSNLQQTQFQLVEAEKMAALGNLAANIAHELNTPLGAIKSSVKNMEHTLNDAFIHADAFCRALSEDERGEFLRLFHVSLKNVRELSTREERAFRRAIRQRLQARNIPRANELAELFVSVGVYDDGVDQWLSLFTSAEQTELIRMAARFSGLRLDMATMTTAIERASSVIIALKQYAQHDHSGKKVRINVIEGIQTVLTLFRHRLHVGIEVRESYDELPPISCYPSQINQIWLHLITHAIHVMRHQGRLDIRGFRQAADVIVQITYASPNLSDDSEDRLLAPSGGGDGLRLIHKILARHHGRLEQEQTPNQRAFRVALPLEQREIA